MVAAKQGDAERVASLLATGHDPDSTDRNGRTALMYAVASRNLETVSTEGETAIALATRMGRDEIGAVLEAHCGKE